MINMGAFKCDITSKVTVEPASTTFPKLLAAFYEAVCYYGFMTSSTKYKLINQSGRSKAETHAYNIVRQFYSMINMYVCTMSCRCVCAYI